MKISAPKPDLEHPWAQQVLPWMVNETLPVPDVARLCSHLESCAACRADLEFERRIAARVAQDVVVPHAPQAGFARLLQRIDEAQTDTTQSDTGQTGGWWRRRSARRPGSVDVRRPWFAVAVAAQAAAFLVLSLTTAWLALGPERAPDYRTLSRASPVIPGDHLQVVFADTVTAADMQRLLGAIGGHIVGGPSPAGVVLVAVTAGPEAPDLEAPDLEAAAQRLSKEPGVVFVAMQRQVETP